MEQKNNKPNLFVVISEVEAKSVPYPYVYVNDDGTVRELQQSERSYLEKPFNPFDGNRPYTKGSYDEKDGRGRLGGFCPRVKIPSGADILLPPKE